MPKNLNVSVKPAFALIGSLKEIEARIIGMHSTAQSLQTEMHVIACSALQRLGKHGDIRIVLKMLNAMPEMARKNALIDWFTAFGPIAFTEENKVLSAMHVKDGKTKLADAMAKPFWKFKANEGAPYEPINFDTYISAQVKKLEKDAKETGRDHTHLIMALKGYNYRGTAGAPVQVAETLNS